MTKQTFTENTVLLQHLYTRVGVVGSLTQHRPDVHRCTLLGSKAPESTPFLMPPTIQHVRELRC